MSIETRIAAANIGELFTPEIMLPSQMAPAATETPYQRLAVAILYDLMRQAQAYAQRVSMGQAIRPALAKQIEADRAWVNSAARDPFSFLMCIELIGGHEQQWRERINTILSGEARIRRIARCAHRTTGKVTARRPRG